MCLFRVTKHTECTGLIVAMGSRADLWHVANTGGDSVSFRRKLMLVYERISKESPPSPQGVLTVINADL